MKEKNQVELSNGVKMPLIGLGVWQSKSGSEVQNAIRHALDVGYRHIDTAMIYYNESDVGKAVRSHQIDREDVFITTKLWSTDQGYERTKTAFFKSLRELNMDYVDLYLIHFPSSNKIQESWKAIEELYQRGYIRAIGVSNFHSQHIEYLKETAEIMPMVNQVEFHPYLSQKQLREYTQSQGIQFEAWSPLGMGKLVNDRNLISLSKDIGKSIPQIILRWNIQHGIVTLPKSVHKDYIEQNFDIFDFALTDQQMQFIDSLNCNFRLGPNPDDTIVRG